MNDTRKSKSMSCLEEASRDAIGSENSRRDNNLNVKRVRSRTVSVASDSSQEICVIVESETDHDEKNDSGVADRSHQGDMLTVLEGKMDKLYDMFQEQCRLLSTLKEEIRNSRAEIEKAEEFQQRALGEIIAKVVYERKIKDKASLEADANTNSNAKNLLDAIELRHGFSLDKEIRDSLISFLHSEELKEHMVATTAQSVKDAIEDCMTRDVSNLYVPILEHSHRRLLRAVTKTLEEAFIDLEEKSISLSQSVYKVTRSMRRALDRHQQLLDAASDPQHTLVDTLKLTVQELLHEEMQKWRHKLVKLLSAVPGSAIKPLEPPQPPPGYAPTTSVQRDNERSLIDKLMITVEITKQIEAGQVNEAFERALSAADLTIVMGACRAADRLNQWRLHQHLLLALIQQLSTDVTQDTALKCRYLEYGIIHLDPGNQLTRTHLPLVVGEVRKNLTNFRCCYPNHAANKRVALIIMAADNLLK